MKLTADLFKIGSCYMMIYEDRVIKFKVQAYHVKPKSYSIIICKTRDIIELSGLQAEEMITITPYDCRFCKET